MQISTCHVINSLCKIICVVVFSFFAMQRKQWGILFKYRALAMFTMHAPPVLNSNITKVQQCCTSVLVLPHSSECVLAQDEVSPIACPRVCDHNCHTTWGAVVRICAPNLLAVANNFSASRVVFHCLHNYYQQRLIYLVACTTAYPIPIETCWCWNIAIIEFCPKRSILTCSS